MAWADKLLRATYTAASGTSVEFDYEAIQGEKTYHGTAFDFPGYRGTYAQRTGASARRHPLRVYFSGPDYEIAADTFERILEEVEPGQLTLPLYGTITATVLGDYKRTDSLVRGANQCTIQVTFYETNGFVYPVPGADPVNAFANARTRAADTIAAQAPSDLSFDNLRDQSDFIGRFNSGIGQVYNALSPISSAEASVQRGFTRAYRSLLNASSTLIGDPISMAYNAIELVRYPTRAAGRISDILDGYGNLIDDLLDGGNTGVKEDYQSNWLLGTSAVLASAEAGTNAAANNATSRDGFETRDQAVSAAADLVDRLDQLSSWRDESQQQIGDLPTDPGAEQQQLRDAVLTAAGAMLQASFGLAVRRVYTVRRPTTLINLCARLYGAVDDATLDTFIVSNQLTGDQIIELQTGDRVVYYE